MGARVTSTGLILPESVLWLVGADKHSGLYCLRKKKEMQGGGVGRAAGVWAKGWMVLSWKLVCNHNRMNGRARCVGCGKQGPPTPHRHPLGSE